MTADTYCQEKGAPPGSSLHYALLFAPADRRAALTALSAWRREVGSIVRECSDAGVAAVKLNWWRKELGRLFDGQPSHPVTQSLAEPVHTRSLPADYFHQVLEGVRMDLEYGSYPGFRELSVYCHSTGCAAAHLAVKIAGYREPETARFGHDLGMGLQLASLLRNVRRDAAAGRVYIPEDELRDAGLDRSALLDHNADPEALRQLLAQQAQRARDFLKQARERLPAADVPAQRTGLILAALQERLLDVMEEDGFPLLERRHHLTPLYKLWIAWRTGLRARRGRI